MGSCGPCSVVKQNLRTISIHLELGLIRVALLLYRPPTRFLGVTWFIQVKKSNKNHYFSLKVRTIWKKSDFLVTMRATERAITITVFLPMKSQCKKILTWENTVNFRISYYKHLKLKKKKIHMLLSGMGVMGRFTCPLGITRPLPDITPTTGGQRQKS